VSNLPPDDAGELDWLLFRQDDVISRRQALRLMSESQLRHVVFAGRWSLPFRGIYVAHNGPMTGEQRRWIGSLAAGSGRPAPLAGATALQTYGLRGYESGVVHVYVPARLRPRNLPGFVIVHRTTQLARTDLQIGPPPRTSACRAVIDAAQWSATDDRARAIIAAAVQQRLVDGGGMMRALARMTRVRRRCLITTTINDAAGGCESIAEQDFLRLCRRGGLPMPNRQSATVDSSGRRRYRDAHFEEWSVHVEIDGGHHTEVRQWWLDMRRQNDMGIAGDRVLRFPAWAIRHDADRVLSQVRAALVAAGWQP